MSGAQNGNRTRDLVLTKDVLYRLSHLGQCRDAEPAKLDSLSLGRFIYLSELFVSRQPRASTMRLLCSVSRSSRQLGLSLLVPSQETALC